MVRLLAIGAAVCALGATQGSAFPEATDFERAVREVETARGLTFRRDPQRLGVSADDRTFLALQRSPRRIAVACPTAGFRMQEQVGALADFEHDRILVLPDAESVAVRAALGQLLDAQYYPELTRDAATLAGDAGVAQRGLLAASACAAAQGGLGPAPSESAADPFADPVIEIPEPVGDVSVYATPNLAASGFLLRQADREAPFRRPPRSTAELFVPGLWERSRAPLAVKGDPPKPPGCRVDRDESLGVLALARALAERGGSVPRGALVGWSGDRLVQLACEDGREPWLYVARFATEGDANDFRGAAELLLPVALPRPASVAADGARVAVWHDLTEDEARRLGADPERPKP